MTNFIFRTLSAEVNSQKEDVAAYQESIAFKDETVMALTNQIDELQQQGGNQRPLQDMSTNTSLRAMVDVREMNRLKVG